MVVPPLQAVDGVTPQHALPGEAEWFVVWGIQDMSARRAELLIDISPEG
jgi:hypothetical protein